MKVMMLILETPDDFEKRSGGPAGEAYWSAWQAYSDAVRDKTVGGNILAGREQAATLRVRNGERQIQDGPYADTKEALGGYFVFEVDRFEEAVELASTCPAAGSGAVELRPIVTMSG